MAKSVQPLDHDPVVPSEIRRRPDVLALNQLRKNLRRTFERKPHPIQPQHGEHLLPHYETEGIAPLKLLRRFGKRHAVSANGIYVHSQFLFRAGTTFSQIEIPGAFRIPRKADYAQSARISVV